MTVRLWLTGSLSTQWRVCCHALFVGWWSSYGQILWQMSKLSEDFHRPWGGSADGSGYAAAAVHILSGGGGGGWEFSAWEGCPHLAGQIQRTDSAHLWTATGVRGNQTSTSLAGAGTHWHQKAHTVRTHSSGVILFEPEHTDLRKLTWCVCTLLVLFCWIQHTLT